MQQVKSEGAYQVTDGTLDTLDILRRLGRGETLHDLAAALTSVATEVVETGQPGEVTLKLKLTTREQGDTMVQISDSITRKTPTPASRGQYLFAYQGWLYSEDPQQAKLPFRAVDRPEPEQRQLDDAAPLVREA